MKKKKLKQRGKKLEQDSERLEQAEIIQRRQMIRTDPRPPVYGPVFSY